MAMTMANNVPRLCRWCRWLAEQMWLSAFNSCTWKSSDGYFEHCLVLPKKSLLLSAELRLWITYCTSR